MVTAQRQTKQRTWPRTPFCSQKIFSIWLRQRSGVKFLDIVLVIVQIFTYFLHYCVILAFKNFKKFVRESCFLQAATFWATEENVRTIFLYRNLIL